MCLISLDRGEITLFFVCIVCCLPRLDPEILPFFYNGGRPLVSILNPYLVEDRGPIPRGPVPQEPPLIRPIFDIHS